ncbi:MAG: PilZ domain-containing protein [Clostridia bacterium]|nr:PilZ domain-containing protein [Deltaproteobacteria bacterium]
MNRSDRRVADRRRDASKTNGERRRTDRRTERGDRRGEERLPLELWMEELAGDDIYFRRSGNIASGGVFFDRAIPHPLGTVVTLKFALPGDREMVVARGEVVSAAAAGEGLGMGVKFVHVEGDGQKRIRAFLKSA